MINKILLTVAGRPIYASAAMITLGVFLCVLLTLALYRSRHRSGAAVMVLAVLGFLFGVLFSRFLHWYFNAEAYSSLLTALTDYSTGSFCLPGMLLGVWLAAWITKKLGLTETVGELLDAAAPGMALLIALIRLSALFNTTCRSRIIIKTPWIQFLPFATGLTDTAGNVTYRLATFFLEALLLFGVAGSVFVFYKEKSQRRMRKGCPRTGNAARYFVLLYAAIEIVADSTRYDSPLMHFRLIPVLNQYSAFISLAQIFAGFTVLGILIKLSICSIRANRFHLYHLLSWIGFLFCLFGIGKLGEYNVQRYATYVKCYSIMSGCCLLLVLIVWGIYKSCVSRREL